jgi:hypothetical protein
MPPFIVSPTVSLPAGLPLARRASGNYPQPQHRARSRTSVTVRGNRHPAYYRGLPRWTWELAAN